MPTERSPKETRQWFLSFLLDLLPDTHDLLLWFKNAKNPTENCSVFAHDLQTGLDALDQRVNDWHCYWGVGTRPQQTGPRPHWRGAEVDVLALLCAHLDLDIADSTAHSETRLPPTVKDALWIVSRLPIPPTLILNSGYGLGVLYFFKEPEILVTTADRMAAKDAVFRLQEAARLIAREKGWTIDSTQDLARVLRFPGTWNLKGEQKRATTIYSR